MRSLLPTRTAITWVECFPSCAIFVPGCCGWAPTRASRPMRRSWPRPTGSTSRSKSMAAGDHFAFGGAQVEVLAPAADYVPGAAASNDDSLVLHVAYGKTSVLLEGRCPSGQRAADAFRRAPLRPAEGWPPRQQDVDHSPLPGCGGAHVCRHLGRPTTIPMAIPKWKSSTACRTATSEPFAPMPWALRPSISMEAR